MTVSPAGSGTVTSPDFSTPVIVTDSEEYTCSTTYTLTAVPNTSEKYKFDRWGGSVSGSTETITIKADAVKSVTAFFILKTEPVSLQEAKSLVENTKFLLVLDVRSASDYTASHMLCAKNYIWNSGANNFSTSIKDLTSYKEVDILLYDKDGTKSEAAARYLAEQGFELVFYMTDAFDPNWIAVYETFTTGNYPGGDSDICTSLPPLAYAGTDQPVNEKQEVTLDGSGSSRGVTYSWLQVGGVNDVNLSNSEAQKPTFTAPDLNGGNDELIFYLTVTDGDGNTDTDTVKVTVSSSGSSTLVSPTGLAANAVSYRKIMLRWTDNSPDKNSSFKIERKKKYCSDETYNWAQIATVQSDEKAKNYEDIGNFDLGIKYSYRVRAYSGSENSDYSNCASILYPMPDAAGTPSAPVNLVATYSSSSIIDLSWDQWGSTVTKFDIYRQVNNSGSWTLLATNTPDVLTYSDKNATNNQTANFYSYYVQACNAAGCSPTTYKVGVPYNPMNLSASVNAQNKIVLQWTDNSDDERGFEIYRKIGGCSSSASWEKVKQAGISRETVTAGSATSGTYSYKIRAYYRSWGIPYVYGYSDWSACVEIVAP